MGSPILLEKDISHYPGTGPKVIGKLELIATEDLVRQQSNQLAKYLSPQVYRSIFLGDEQVKITSNRKDCGAIRGLSIHFVAEWEFTRITAQSGISAVKTAWTTPSLAVL